LQAKFLKLQKSLFGPPDSFRATSRAGIGCFSCPLSLPRTASCSLKSATCPQRQHLAELTSAKGCVKDWLTVTNWIPACQRRIRPFSVTKRWVTAPSPLDRLLHLMRLKTEPRIVHRVLGPVQIASCTFAVQHFQPRILLKNSQSHLSRSRNAVRFWEEFRTHCIFNISCACLCGVMSFLTRAWRSNVLLSALVGPLELSR
jgi:hypothetical protein